MKGKIIIRVETAPLCRVPDELADRRDAAHRRLRDLAWEAEAATGIPLTQALEAAHRADQAYIRAIDRAAAERRP